MQHVTILVIQTLLNLSCPLPGKGQSRVKNFDEVDAAWEYAMQGGRVNQGTVIIESQIDFDFEITLLTVRAKAQKRNQVHYCDQLDTVRMRVTMLKAGSHNQ